MSANGTAAGVVSLGMVHERRVLFRYDDAVLHASAAAFGRSFFPAVYRHCQSCWRRGHHRDPHVCLCSCCPFYGCCGRFGQNKKRKHYASITPMYHAGSKETAAPYYAISEVQTQGQPSYSQPYEGLVT